MKIFYVCHDGDKKGAVKEKQTNKTLWLYVVQNCWFYLSTGGSRSLPSSAWWAGSPSPAARPNTAGFQSPLSPPSTSASCRPGGERAPSLLLCDVGGRDSGREREKRGREQMNMKWLTNQRSILSSVGIKFHILIPRTKWDVCPK